MLTSCNENINGSISICGKHLLIAFLFLAAVVGLIPESGPHLVFVTLFYHGIIPFSVLLTSSIIQDGQQYASVAVVFDKRFNKN